MSLARFSASPASRSYTLTLICVSPFALRDNSTLDSDGGRSVVASSHSRSALLGRFPAAIFSAQRARIRSDRSAIDPPFDLLGGVARLELVYVHAYDVPASLLALVDAPFLGFGR